SLAPPALDTASASRSKRNHTITFTPACASLFQANTTFTLTYGGKTTGPIPATASAADVQAALTALPSIGKDNVDVNGDPGGPYTITLRGDQAMDLRSLTATDPTVKNLVQVDVPEPFSDPERAAERCPGPLGDAIQMAF